MSDKLSEWKREMVTLFLPFKCEHTEVLDHLKYLQLFDDHREEVMNNFAKYELCDIQKQIDLYNTVNRELEQEREAVDAVNQNRIRLMQTTEANNDDFDFIPNGPLTAIVRQKSNVMTSAEFCEKMRLTNPQQRDFLLTLMNTLLNKNQIMQVFFTGAAGTGKTFTINLAKEIVNRFTQKRSMTTNAFVACASTGKAAVAINGSTVHSTFRIAISRRENAAMSRETIQSYRNAFANVEVIFIDEVSMISSDILHKIHGRMGDITGNFDEPFGGMSVIFCGDLRQLPPVNARPIYKPLRDTLNGAMLWQSLKFYTLTTVMRQSDALFSNILTKIGDGKELNPEEAAIIESRFKTEQWCKENKPNVIRLFHKNCDVEKYNLEAIPNFITSQCNDTFEGYNNNQELISARTKLHTLNITECAGMLYLLRLSLNKPYMITCNIDVEDGLVNGAIGTAKYFEYDVDDSNRLLRIWLEFENEYIGEKLRIRSRPLVASKPGVLCHNWTPLSKRHAKISITDKIKCTRIQFPITPTASLTIHKSQGGTFNEVVFKYLKSQDQQLVYVALSRVTSLDGLFLTNESDDFIFHHKKGSNSPKIIELRQELQRLQNYKLLTIQNEAEHFMKADKYTLITFNVQSLNAHKVDIENDRLLQTVNCLLLNETWLKNDDVVNIQNFQLVTQQKHNNIRSGGVSIYIKSSDYDMIQPSKVQNQFWQQSTIGDLCGMRIILNNVQLLLISIYIHPNTTLRDLKIFLLENLIVYTSRGQNFPTLSDTNYDTMPIILAGDFNTDILKNENQELLEFMNEHFNLKLRSSKTSTTTGNTCIDMVFARNINIQCHTHLSYFSYHKPILIQIE